MIGIVLRGPTGVGKTTVAEALLGMLHQPAHTLVNLDCGWLDTEHRCTRVPERYPDLRQRDEPVLVIELANGEPVRNILEFMTSTQPIEPSLWSRSPGPGATVNPEEWVELLQSDGRELHSFLFSIDWPTVCARKGDSNQLRRWHDLYMQPSWVDFASRARIAEETLTVNIASPTEIAREILRKLNLRKER